MSEIRSRIRKRAAAAFGVTAFAAMTSAAAYDHFADRAMESVSAPGVQVQELGSEPLTYGQIDWMPHPDNAELVAATTTIEGKDGPVRFHFNQSDEISAEYFDPGFIPLIDDKPVVNDFSAEAIRNMSESLNTIASTQTGQDVISRLSNEFSGNVQISRLPDDDNAAGRARVMLDYSVFNLTPDNIKVARDETHDVPRIGVHEGVAVATKYSDLGLSGHGTPEVMGLDALLMHELGHAINADPRALHIRDEHGYVSTYTADGEVRDLALHAENIYRRELAGKDIDMPTPSDTLIYNAEPRNNIVNGLADHPEFEDGRRRAHYERYSYMQAPGMEFDQAQSSVASGLGGLRLSDEEFKAHTGQLALHAMLYTGGPVRIGDDVEKPSLQEAADWLEKTDSANSDKQISRRYAHEVEGALRISDYREKVKGMSIDGATLLDARIDKAARQDPEKAISLFQEAVHPENEDRSAAAARDVLDTNGVYASTKNFLAEHEEFRKGFALKETLRSIDEGDGFAKGIKKAAARQYAGMTSFFEHGQDADQTRYHAVATKMGMDQTFLLSQAETEKEAPRPRRTASLER